MKTRSQAAGLKKRSEASKSNDEEKPKSETKSKGALHCGECKAVSQIADATKRADGTFECPGCGAPVEEGDVATDAPAPIPDRKNEERPPRATNPPPQMYCDQCGAAWPRVEGRIHPNCGHTEGMVDDPRKAKNWNPPAGHPRPDATKADPKRSPPEGGTLASPENPIRIDGNRLDVTLGKMVFRLADYGVNLTVGPFESSVVVPEGGDRVTEGAKVLRDLRALADTSFAEQLEWYCSRLGIIEKKLNGS